MCQILGWILGIKIKSLKLCNLQGDHSPEDKREINQIVMILSQAQLLPPPSSSLCFSHFASLTEQLKLGPTSGPLHIVPFAWNTLPPDRCQALFPYPVLWSNIFSQWFTLIIFFMIKEWSVPLSLLNFFSLKDLLILIVCYTRICWLFFLPPPEYRFLWG